MQPSLYQNLLRPLLFGMDPEVSHQLVTSFASLATPVWTACKGVYTYSKKDLKVDLAGTILANPVGLAAGFDKNAKLTEVLGNIGFGFAEVGSVCAKSFCGNPKPRLFRLEEDAALINRMGLNGEGADVIAERLAPANFSLPIGLNIAKTNDPNISGELAIADILYTFGRIKHLPLAYVALNVSCPNTREEQIAESNLFADIINEVQKANSAKLPLFIKLSPDSSFALIEQIVDIANRNFISGFILGNTTINRDGLKTSAEQLQAIGAGGLSGRPLKPLALKLCGHVARLKQANQQIIASGGIFSGKDAYEFIRLGAQAVQVYTGLVYFGPGLPKQINQELSSLLKSAGLTLEEARGLDVCRTTI